MDGSRRSPGFASQNVSLLSVSFHSTSAYCNRPSQGLLEIPSDRLRCPRLQLRGSAGFSPASHSAGVSPAYDHARTQFEKEQKQQPRQSTGRASTKSNVRSASGSSLRVLEDGKLRRSHLRNVFLGVARDAFERRLQLPVKLAHRRIVRTGGNSNLCAHAHQRL